MSTTARTPTATARVVVLDRHEVVGLYRTALERAGAARRVAELLTEAALFAEDRGQPGAGVSHLLSQVDALEEGRLDGRAAPRLCRPSPAAFTSDASGGIAQAGFDEGFTGFAQAARRYGVATFVQERAFSCGPLGWFTERMADAGLVAFATATAPVGVDAGPRAGRGTAPMACSVPRAGRAPVTVDCGPAAAEGVALLVELLSSMAGGGWTVDAPPGISGWPSPSAGMFVLAVDHSALGQSFPVRVENHLQRLAGLRVPLPGERVCAPSVDTDHLALDADVAAALRRRAVGSRR